jgi:hypothetical protein
MNDQRKAKALSVMHYSLAGVWALMLVPTLLLWKSSVLWVAAMSLYANFIGHLSAAQASKAEQSSEENGDDDA